ncbi:MAG TPA: uL15m family ribosomal protein [Candidatus Paceibacterota bacterium]|nr:uL15m family ribosomal protein [Candidatus Paceibacterota bacterium]
MQIHQLPSIQKKTQRIGRSGKRGSYSGRGVKGQKSRSGHRIRPAERDLLIRLPKRRGFRNKPKTDRPEVFNLGTLSSRLKSYVQGGTLELTNDLFRTSGLVRKDFRGAVKILGTGEINFPVSVAKGIEVSKSATMKIKKAGGSVA